MKFIHRTTLFVSAATLCASVAWAAEPPQADASTNGAANNAASAGTPAPANTTTDAAATNSTPPTTAPVAPVAAPPSPVETSPYGNGQNDPAPTTTAAAPPPEAAPKEDAPATLFASGSDYSIGGFGGIGVMYTRFVGSDRPLVCGEGAVIIDHKFTLGGGGCGIAAMMNGEKYGNPPHSTNDRMSFGYGGAIVRYHFFSRQAVNLGVGGLIGAGGLEIATYDGDGDTDDWDNYDRKHPDAVFVAEPQVGGYANLTRWLRVGAVVGYRFVSGVDTKGLSNSDLMGPTVGGQIQAGWF